ncbi:MAG: orotidine-5'-phosphate decarboxylase [Pseudomonadota bacterium]
MASFPTRDIQPAQARERLIVALDVPTVGEAEGLVTRLDGLVSFFKVGYWLQLAAGFDGLIGSLIAANKRVFLDAKIFDIAETVREGVARAADRGVSFLTVHGNAAILKAAMAGRKGRDIKVFAVSVLTSLDDADLRELGYTCSLEQLIEIRVHKAIEYDVDGIIAAPQDTGKIRAIAGAERLSIATPGVRPAGGHAHDHKRAGTPAQAITAGADYLILGRPIVRAPDPAAAAAAILAEMQAAFAARK